jgi:hypothetical protein
MWRVCAWMVDPTDPYRIGRSIIGWDTPSHALALAVADQWSDDLAPFGSCVIVEVWPIG